MEKHLSVLDTTNWRLLHHMIQKIKELSFDQIGPKVFAKMFELFPET